MNLINKGFGSSGCYNVNLVQKHSNFYVMDNHGAALWCWLQEINLSERYNFIHIDTHYDTLNVNMDLWIGSSINKFNEKNINDYFGLQYNLSGEIYQTIRWDNYIPIFYNLHNSLIEKYYFYTHRHGTSGVKFCKEDKIEEFQPHTIFENLSYTILDEEFKFIFNLDIDYFFLRHDDKYFQVFSDESIEIIFDQIAEVYFANRLEVITVALSPECCGGWNNSIRIYNMLATRLSIKNIVLS
jgi:hypothetical protein